jgi:guanine deaminase
MDIDPDQVRQFLQRAIDLSRQSIQTGHGGPFGAVIVRAGQIIGEGFNRVISDIDPTAHAEIVAIRNTCKNTGQYWLDDAVLFSSCEPCPMCLCATYWARIPQIYYANTSADAQAHGFDDKIFYDELARPASQRRIRMEHIESSDALAVFHEWSAIVNRKKY